MTNSFVCVPSTTRMSFRSDVADDWTAVNRWWISGVTGAALLCSMTPNSGRLGVLSVGKVFLVNFAWFACAYTSAYLYIDGNGDVARVFAVLGALLALLCFLPVSVLRAIHAKLS